MAAYAGELLGQYIAVTALDQETNRERFGAAGQEEIHAWLEQYRGHLEKLPASQFPNLIQMARSGQLMAPGTDEERFELGLDILVRGLASFSTRTDG